LVSGETGIGKSTLIDTLFNTQFDSVPVNHDLPSVRLKAHTYGIYLERDAQRQREIVTFVHTIVTIITKPVGSHSLSKTSFRLLNWENPLLVIFDISALMVRKTVSKYIVSVAFAIKPF